MSRRNIRFAKLLIATAALLFIPIAQAQLTSIGPSQRLPLPPNTAPLPTEPARFGEFVATDGRTILVTVSQGPAAYAYRKDGERWVFQGALAPSDGTTRNSGAVRGNVAVVSGTVGEQDAVFIFLRSQGQWLQTQTITGFIFSTEFNMVTLGPDYLAIGDLAVNEFRGAVHIYNETGAGTYALDSTLTTSNPDAGPGYLLGFSPIASRNTVLAAAPGGEKVHAFFRAGGLWTEQAELPVPSVPQFAFSGNRTIIGQPQFFGQPSRPKEFIRSGGVWAAGGELIHPQEPEKGLGVMISMDDTRAVAAESSGDFEVRTDDAIAFELGSAGWAATTRLRGANRVSECGRITLAMADTLVVASCPNAETGNPVFAGRVRIYNLPE